MAPESTTEPVYSVDRARRLRTCLWVVAAVAVLLAVAAAFTLVAVVPDDADFAPFALVLGGVAVVLMTSAGVTMRLLDARRRPAKRAAVTTGVLLVLVGLLLSGVWVGYVLPILGLVVLLLALLPDDPSADLA